MHPISTRRIALALLALAAPFARASAQQLELSEVRPGHQTHIALVHAEPNSEVAFELRFQGDEPGSPRISRLRKRVDRAGRSSLLVPYPGGMGPGSFTVSASIALPGGGSHRLRVATPVNGVQAQPKISRDDDFEGSTLDNSWSLLNPDLMEFEVSGGALRISPTQFGSSATWVSGNQGPFIYKTFLGNFDARTTVHTESSSSPGNPALGPFRLGGLMVRDASVGSTELNSAHIAVGAGSSPFPIAVEDKTTYDSTSNWFFHAIPSQDLELRITRVGDLISRMYRPVSGGSWTVMRADSHPEFQPAVQVGLMAYSFSGPADIRASFDEIRFQ